MYVIEFLDFNLYALNFGKDINIFFALKIH